MQPLERGTGEGVGVDVERFVVGRRGEGPQFCSSKPERRRRVRDGVTGLTRSGRGFVIIQIKSDTVQAHNLIQEDYKNPDDHLFLQSACYKYGIWYSPPGNGVSHPVHMERFGN